MVCPWSEQNIVKNRHFNDVQWIKKMYDVLKNSLIITGSCLYFWWHIEKLSSSCYFFNNIMMQSFNWNNQFWLLFHTASYWRGKYLLVVQITLHSFLLLCRVICISSLLACWKRVHPAFTDSGVNLHFPTAIKNVEFGLTWEDKYLSLLTPMLDVLTSLSYY